MLILFFFKKQDNITRPRPSHNKISTHLFHSESICLSISRESKIATDKLKFELKLVFDINISILLYTIDFI